MPGIEITRGAPPVGRFPTPTSGGGITTSQDQAPPPARVEAPVEVPVEAAPVRRAAPAALAELGPLEVHVRTVEGLRDLAHLSLLVADSALDRPAGAELLHLASTIQSVLARAVAGQSARVEAPAAPAEAPVEAPAAPAEAPVEAPAAPAEAPAAPASVEARVEVSVEAPVEAPVEAAPPKAAKK